MYPLWRRGVARPARPKCGEDSSWEDAEQTFSRLPTSERVRSSSVRSAVTPSKDRKFSNRFSNCDHQDQNPEGQWGKGEGNPRAAPRPRAARGASWRF